MLLKLSISLSSFLTGLCAIVGGVSTVVAFLVIRHQLMLRSQTVSLRVNRGDIELLEEARRQDKVRLQREKTMRMMDVIDHAAAALGITRKLAQALDKLVHPQAKAKQ